MNPPAYRNNTTDNINYNPAIDFDGVDDGLNFGSDYIFSSGTGTEDGMTWFAIVQPDDAPSTKTFQGVFDFGWVASAGYGMFYGSATHFYYSAINSGGVYSGDLPHTNGTKTTLNRFTIDFADIQTGHLNGASVYSNPITLPALSGAQISETPSSGSASGPFTLGRQAKTGLSGNDGSLLDGSIAEIIGYNRVLSPAEVQAIESYLAIKYGITLESSNYVNAEGTILWDATANAPCLLYTSPSPRDS